MNHRWNNGHMVTAGNSVVMLMLDIARHQQGGPVRAVDIVARQSSSISHVEQLVSKMRRADLVMSMHGRGGGYRLTRKGITVAEILDAAQQPLAPQRSELSTEAGAVDALWTTADEMVRRLFQATTLEGLAAQLPEVQAKPVPKPAPRPIVVQRSMPRAPNSVFDLARQPIVERDRP